MEKQPCIRPTATATFEDLSQGNSQHTALSPHVPQLLSQTNPIEEALIKTAGLLTGFPQDASDALRGLT